MPAYKKGKRYIIPRLFSVELTQPNGAVLSKQMGVAFTYTDAKRIINAVKAMYYHHKAAVLVQEPLAPLDAKLPFKVRPSSRVEIRSLWVTQTTWAR